MSLCVVYNLFLKEEGGSSMLFQLIEELRRGLPQFTFDLHPRGCLIQAQSKAAVWRLWTTSQRDGGIHIELSQVAYVDEEGAIVFPDAVVEGVAISRDSACRLGREMISIIQV